VPSGDSTYVYCVGYAEPFAQRGRELATLGIGDGRVRRVEFGELAALVSDSPRSRYDISRENLLAHQRVLDDAMTHATVLPVSFGTVAADDDEVRDKFLRREYDELRGYLAYVHGRVELDLRVLWNRERLFAEIVAENPAIRALRDSIADQPADAAYYERVELGQLTEAAIELKSHDEGASILSILEPIAVETRLLDPLADTMLLNAAFLVDREHEPAFDDAVQQLGAAQAERLIVRYVGPLPPHSFISLSVLWEE
jgi:hypothetical protein